MVLDAPIFKHIRVVSKVASVPQVHMNITVNLIFENKKKLK